MTTADLTIAETAKKCRVELGVAKARGYVHLSAYEYPASHRLLATLTFGADDVDDAVVMLLGANTVASGIVRDLREALHLLSHLGISGRLDSLPDGAYAQMTALVERLSNLSGAITKETARKP